MRPRLIAAIDTLLERWPHKRCAKPEGVPPAAAYAAQLEELRQRQTRVGWTKLEEVLSEEAERVFRRRLMDALLMILLRLWWLS